MNSPEALSVKEAWSNLVNVQAAWEDFEHTIGVERFADIGIYEAREKMLKDKDEKTVLIALSSEAFDNAFVFARDKVCETLAVRALSRPPPGKDARALLVDKARGQIKEIRGKLTPQLDMLMNAARTQP